MTHTDHPLRHWDRTCPGCVAQTFDEYYPRLLEVVGAMVACDPESSTPEGVLLGRLAEACDAYEKVRYPI